MVNTFAGIQSAGIQSAGIQSAGIQSAGIQSAGIQSAGIQSSYVIVNCLPVTWETIWISGFYKGNKNAENDTKYCTQIHTNMIQH